MQAGRTCSSKQTCRPGAGIPHARAGRLAVFGGGAVVAALLSFSFVAHAAPESNDTAAATGISKRANFKRETASKEARFIADWVVHSGDNQGLAFAIVDKMQAKVFVFYPDGRLRGAAPVLLGLARGDDSVPGIGDRELSDMPPEVRTTPAGRFMASLGRNASGKDVLWVDYEAAISMHRVIDTNPEERRPQRLQTPTPLDNRISYGCINAPIKFFDDVVSPAFSGSHGVVYVLPEVKPLDKVFAAYDIHDKAPTALASDARPALGDQPQSPLAGNKSAGMSDGD